MLDAGSPGETASGNTPSGIVDKEIVTVSYEDTLWIVRWRDRECVLGGLSAMLFGQLLAAKHDDSNSTSCSNKALHRAVFSEEREERTATVNLRTQIYRLGKTLRGLGAAPSKNGKWIEHHRGARVYYLTRSVTWLPPAQPGSDRARRHCQLRETDGVRLVSGARSSDDE